MNIGGRTMWSHLKVPGVTVSVQRAPKPCVYMYRVVKVMDLGVRGRTAVIEPFNSQDGFQVELLSTPKDKRVVPSRIGNVRFMCASKKQPTLSDLNYMASCVLGGRTLERVVADVLVPGDFLAVRPKRLGEGIHSIETLRVVKTIVKKPRKISLHAV